MLQWPNVGRVPIPRRLQAAEFLHAAFGPETRGRPLLAALFRITYKTTGQAPANGPTHH